MDRIEAVVFDVGRVLFEWNLRHLLEKLVDDSNELEFLLAEVVTEAWHFQHDAGRPLSEMIPERIAEYPRYEPIIRAYASRFNESIPGPVEGTHELVQHLHRRGIPLYALTNFGAELWAGFRPTEEIFDLFDDIVVSGEEKLAKPDPAIFNLAQARFGHRPEALLFIDDNRANVDAAKQCGWQAHFFRNAEILEIDLASRGLLDA